MIKGVGRDKFKLIVLLAVIVIAVLAVINLLTSVGPLSTKNSSDISANLLTWGYDDSGQLGSGSLTLGTVDTRLHPVQTQAIKEVYAGLRHSLALTQDGTVLAWGGNEFGQMGNGNAGGKQVSPKKIEGLPKITMLATKQDHNLALDDQGRVWAWGLNMSGQLGDGTNQDLLKPRLVGGLRDVAFIETGYRSSLAITKDGTVWAWGGNCNVENRDPGLKDLIAQLSIGGYTDVSGGTIDHVTPEDGCNREEFLNIKSYSPKKIEGLPPVATISAGFGHMLAVTKNGELWSWGCNIFGQVGNGTSVDSSATLKPTKVKGIGRVTAASAGYRHSFALTDDGKVWAWGHNYFGELGNPKNTDEVVSKPMQLAGINNVKDIIAGHDYSLAVGSDGKIWGWGQASFGQFGTTETDRRSPGSLFDLQDVESATAGGGHVIVVVKSNGSTK